MAERKKKTGKLEKLRDLNANELEVRQSELAEQIFRLRFQLSTGQSEGLRKLREAKRDMARIKTLLRETELRKA
jgi:large subunit ribosomal protein L29